jgi:methylaspartate mutase sigma subunit
VVLGVTASDAHAVANQLIERDLRSRGFHVVNLGVCTPVADFVRALDEHPRSEALLIGSLNGHAETDLADLPSAVSAGQIRCPIVLGGNLGVGPQADPEQHSRLLGLGVDYLLESAHQLLPLLEWLRRDGDAAVRRRAIAPTGQRSRAA